jgi:membrane fusion protein (multidrug efflux system)
MQGKKGMSVYVVNNDNKVEMRSVEVGDWYESSWIIDSGLNPGEKVVTDGVNKIMPGATVIIQNADGKGT